MYTALKKLHWTHVRFTFNSELESSYGKFQVYRRPAMVSLVGIFDASLLKNHTKKAVNLWVGWTIKGPLLITQLVQDDLASVGEWLLYTIEGYSWHSIYSMCFVSPCPFTKWRNNPVVGLLFNCQT